MPNRNTQDIKRMIATLLKGDATLVSLLGSADRIKHGNPNNLSEYPCITYNLNGGIDEPYEPDHATGIMDDRLHVDMFSGSVDSEQVDAMSDRVYELLHGQPMTASGIRVFSCYRQSFGSIPEPDLKIHHVFHVYRLVTSSGNG